MSQNNMFDEFKKIRLNEKLHLNILNDQRLENLLNFTITFNPNRFSRLDSLCKAPKYAISCIMMTLTKLCEKHQLCKPTIWYVDELMKNGYGHLHGQIKLDSKILEDDNFHIKVKLFDSIYGVLCKKIGNTICKWNTPESKDDSEYPTYYHYMRKDNYHQDNVFYSDKYYQLPKLI